MRVLNRRDFIRYAGAGIGAVAAGCAQAPKKNRCSKRPNILWIMMDDCRADALGCYGEKWPKTPCMDGIANRGVRFQTAIVQNPVCTPSRISMMSGHYPHRFGVLAMGRPQDGVPPQKAKWDAPNLLNAWKQAGIKTVNVGKSGAYDSDWDHRGDIPPLFDALGRPVGYPGSRGEKGHIDADFEKELKLKLQQAPSPYPAVVTETHKWAIGGTIPLEPEQISTSKLGDLAAETLEQLAKDGEPFFFRVSFHAPHVPFRVAPEYLIDPDKIDLPFPTDEELKNKPQFEREALRIYSGAPALTKEQIQLARGTYYGMVALVDVQVGKMVEVLKKAGLMDNTIIVINSDQGLLLGEHGLWKKRAFYDQNICVPFVLSCPALLPEGMVIDEPIEMVDFLPTLMDLSGLDVPDSISGRSLCGLIRGEAKKVRSACFGEIDHSRSMYKELRNGTGRRVMVRTRQWKLEYFMDERVADKDGSLYNLEKDSAEEHNLYGQPKYAGVIKELEGLAEKWNRST